MARQSDIDLEKTLKSKKQLLKDIEDMERRGRKTDWDRKEVVKEILELEEKIAKIDKARLDSIEQQSKARKGYVKLAQEAKKAEEAVDKSLSSRLTALVKGNITAAVGLKSTREHEKEQRKLAGEAKTMAKDALDNGKLDGRQKAGIVSLTQDIKDGLVDEEGIKGRIAALDLDMAEGGKDILNQALGLGKTQQKTAAAGKLAAGNMAKFAKFGAGAGIALKVVFDIAQKFAGSIDAIGKQFGSLNVLGEGFKHELLSSQEAVVGIGATMEDVVSTTNALSSEFGLSLDEAVDLSTQVLDTAKAVGLSNEEAAKLSGTLQTTSGLSGEQAERLTEGAFQLAAANRVNPSAVLKDMAASSEAFASFSENGGDNLAKAAVQARALGLSLDTTAKIAEGLLDFEASIAKEVEASVLIGRQLNFQKARELALNNDIEGAISNVVSQLGSEAEFNKLNSIQRKAIADSIGVSVTDMAKMVANQDKSNMLAGETAKSFADIIGKDAMSELTATMNELKIFGVALANTLGPILMGIAKIVNFVLTPIGQAVSGISRSVRGVDDFHTGPGGITTMMGPAGVFSLNPRDSVLATTNPIPVRRVNDIYTTGAGGLGVGGGNMNVNVTTGGISGRDIPLLAEVEFDGNGTESLSARV